MTENKEAKPDNCSNCKFFDLGGRYGNECHRNPPLTQVGLGSLGVSHEYTRWPSVKHRDWCGEFVQKEDRSGGDIEIAVASMEPGGTMTLKVGDE